jgi:predicted RNA methylase
MLPQDLAPGRAVVVRPSLQRSLALLAAFRVEQSDPDRFYRVLAADSVALVRRWSDLDGLDVLDVGGGPGYFARAFADAGARYGCVEPDTGTLERDPAGSPARLRGSGLDLPLADASVDQRSLRNFVQINVRVLANRPGTGAS